MNDLDDSRDFAEIGEERDVQRITMREAMQWITQGVGFGVVHAGRYTPVEKWALFDPDPTYGTVHPSYRRYALQDCYGSDIPTAEGPRHHYVSVFVWSRPTP
jgi:hypothetical protein